MPHYIVSKEAAKAACIGDVAFLSAYLTNNLHLVNQPTIFQSKLLHIACKAGQVEAAQYLISQGANVGALDYGRIHVINSGRFSNDRNKIAYADCAIVSHLDSELRSAVVAQRHWPLYRWHEENSPALGLSK